MNTEELRKLVNKTDISNRYCTEIELKNSLKKSIDLIRKQIKRNSCVENESQRWLSENFEFIKSVQKSISLKNCLIHLDLKSLVKSVILSGSFNGRKEEVFFILEESSKKVNFKEYETDHFRELFLIASLEALTEKTINDPDSVPRVVQILHELSRIDYLRLGVCFSPVEKVLRHDPTGIYPEMTKASRAMYREKIKTEARRMKVSSEILAKDKLSLAKKEGKHIGFFLEKQRSSFLYFPGILLLASLISAFISVFFESFLIFIFAFPLLYFPLKSFVDYIYSYFRKSNVLPEVRCELVTEKEKTCVAIATLITSKSDIIDQLSKLKRYKLNNKSEKDQLYFGLICDLPQSKKEREAKDEKLINFLKKEIAQMNLDDDCYFAFIRNRVFHKSEDAYVGWERKRGAIEQFINFTVKGDLPEEYHYFGCFDVIGSCFLITLDCDTELGIEQAKRLIGKMLHPLNRPRITKLANGRKYVTSGHGILQPRVASSLLNPITTPFAKIYSNGSGKIPYAGASFDSMQTLFGEGNFCGKGIIDVAAYHSVICSAFPEQRILSHDMPEGALLRCGIASDEFFLDSDPQDAISSDKRLHRWIRGDVQNIILFRQLPRIRVFFAVENLFRYFVPIIELLFLFFASFISKKMAMIASVFIVSLEFLPLFNEVLSFLFSQNFQLFGRRFRTKMRNQLLNTLYRCLLSLSGIAHKAFYYSDAIFRSSYRMIVSKKKLLEWQTYSPFTKNKKNSILFYFPSILIAIFLLFLSNSAIFLLLSISFIFYPFVMLFLSQSYVESDLLSDAEKEKLFEMAKLEFKFFSTTVNEKSSFLPPDNVQFEPIEKIANRTSPTNIGLYFASLISAVELQILSQKECLKLLKKGFDSIEKMEHFQGHLYNWYDLSTLGVIGERFVSTVDSGNYIASLVVLSQTLSDWNTQDAIELRERVEREIRQANFKALFDWSENLFYVGIYPEDSERVKSHYDLYMSEIRTTSYLAIALGQIPPSHWYSTARPVLALSGRVGLASWSGTCFEYFMPSLFLPIVENSLEDESLDFAYFCQKKYAVSTEYGDLFGISESGFLRTDDAGNLQYLAFGVPNLSINERMFDNKVFSPYSSFLMLQKGGKKILDNLRTFRNLGALGPMGYYEAIEFNSNFIDDYGIVRSYMSHHKGMSFLALANILCEKNNTTRFMSREDFSTKKELLGERFPIEGKIYRKKNIKPERSKNSSEQYKIVNSFNKIRDASSVLTDGKIALISSVDGKNRFVFDGIDAFNPRTEGIKFSVLTGNEKFTLQKNEKNCKIQLSNAGLEQFYIKDKKSVLLKISPVFEKNAFLLRIELNGFSEKGRLEIEFDLMLMNERDFRAHPAFHNLSLEASSNGSTLLLRRRGVNCHRELYVSSYRNFKTILKGFDETEIFDFRMLYEPKVKIAIDFSSAENLIIPFVFSMSDEKELIFKQCLDGSFELTGSAAEFGKRKLRRIDEICKTTNDSLEKTVELLSHKKDLRKYFLSDLTARPKESLWKFGISGDYPIISLFLSENASNEMKNIGAYLSAYKKIMLAGICDFDLVILHPKGDGYFDPIRDLLSNLVSHYQCEFMIGKHPGIHFAVYEENDLPFWQSVSNSILSGGKDFNSALVEQKNLSPIKKIFKENSAIERVGEFSNNSFAINKDQFDPTVPFSHVIADLRTGFVCNQNSLGFTWFRNSGLNRISQWDNLPQKGDGEKVYLELDGNFYDLLQMANKVTFREGLVIYEGNLFEEAYSVFATITEKISIKCVLVFLSKKLQENSKLIYSFIPCLGQFPSQNVLMKMSDQFITLSPSVSQEYSDQALIYADEREISTFRMDERLCFSIKSNEKNVFFLGGFNGYSHFKFLKRQLSESSEAILLDSIQSKIDIDPHKESTLEFWLRCQVLYARFWGRTGAYQSSGAYGFRDQLQDCLAFLKQNPNRTKIHLIRCAAHQFEEGDVLHWWHPIRKADRWDPGIRSLCGDDYLWLLYGVTSYIRETGDQDILSIPIHFLTGDLLKPGESERYISPKKGMSGTMLQHLECAVKLFISRGLGKHNLPDIGCGDWNDGMNQVDGESVWLGFFGAICLNRAKKYFSKALQAEIEAFLRKLKEGLEASFNGFWYVRVYRRNGQILGNDTRLESECSIDLITQAFAAFYFLEFRRSPFEIEEKKVERALNAAYEILVDSDHRIIKLFSKPFMNTDPSPGYIQRYCAGVRENGGQYTHAAVWFALALLKFGKCFNNHDLIQKGIALKKLLDPTENINYERFKIYQREPYVLCGDVYDAKGFRGHGGWSWYTGAAAWYLKLLEEIKQIDPDKYDSEHL